MKPSTGGPGGPRGGGRGGGSGGRGGGGGGNHNGESGGDWFFSLVVSLANVAPLAGLFGFVRHAGHSHPRSPASSGRAVATSRGASASAVSALWMLA